MKILKKSYLGSRKMRGKFGGINKDTWVSIGDMSPIQFDLEVFVFWVGVQYG